MRQMAVAIPIVLLVFWISLAPAEDYKIIQKLDIPSDVVLQNVILSPDGRSLAYAIENNGKVSIWINGKKSSPEFDYIGKSFFSPDGSRFVYVANTGGSKKKYDYGFIQVTGGEWCIMMGYEKIECDFADELQDVNPIFSPDGIKLTYKVKKNKAWAFMINGKKVSLDNVKYSVFSRDGSKVAYVKEDRSVWINEDQISPGLNFKDFLSFSPDGSRLAYVAKGAGKEFVMINGKKVSSEYDSRSKLGYDRLDMLDLIKNLTFSPDSRRLAYVTKGDNKKYSVWVDNKRVSPEFDGVEGIVFSPDSRKLAYEAKKGGSKGSKRLKIEVPDKLPYATNKGEAKAGVDTKDEKWFVMMGPKKISPDFDFISDLTFSPDGSQLAIAAGINKKYVVLLNGKQIFDRPVVKTSQSSGGFFFSPDGKKLAYRSVSKDKVFVMINDKKITPSFDFVDFAEEHFEKTGELIFFGYDKEKKVIIHASLTP